MLRWSLYWVASSTDPERKQRVVTVRMYRTLEDMDQSSVPGAFERAHPGERAAQVLPPLMRMRDIVHREIWEIVDDAAVGRTGLPGKFAIVDYFDTSPGADPLTMEREVWKPLHRARVDAGKITDWGVYQVLVPSSELYPYDYVTVNSFDTNAALRDPYPPELVQRVLDGRDAQDVVGRTREARTPVKQEYWHRYISTK